jgi:hypothetical protein
MMIIEYKSYILYNTYMLERVVGFFRKEEKAQFIEIKRPYYAGPCYTCPQWEVQQVTGGGTKIGKCKEGAGTTKSFDTCKVEVTETVKAD